MKEPEPLVWPENIEWLGGVAPTIGAGELVIELVWNPTKGLYQANQYGVREITYDSVTNDTTD